MPDDLQDSFVRPRRRHNDKINWKRVATYVLGSMPLWGPTAWGATNYAIQLRDQWTVMQKELPELRREVDELKKVAKEDHKGTLDLHERRLDKIERWKCILGWDPHKEPRNRDRVCPEEQ
jgi:replication-associated recombination protein RarA